MSSTQTIELRPITVVAVTPPNKTSPPTFPRGDSTSPINHDNDSSSSSSSNATNIALAIPNGGYGWTITFSCSLLTFWFNGISGSWGILQTALLTTTLPTSTPTSTITFVGSLSITLCALLSIPTLHLLSRLSARPTSLLGTLLMGLGLLLASLTTSSLPRLFLTISLLFGLGASLIYSVSNSLPPQYFSSRLGTANSLIKFGGGLGSTLLSLLSQYLITTLSIAWTLRILGLLTLLTGLPAALLIRQRHPVPNPPILSSIRTLFNSLPYTALFLASATGTFSLFIPPFFLPLFAQSAGYTPKTGAALTAAFNACTALGRLGAGPLCDRIGAVNTFLLTMSLNAVSALAIWPLAGEGRLGVLVGFAVVNGVANGGFFVAGVTAVAGVSVGVGKGRSGRGRERGSGSGSDGGGGRGGGNGRERMAQGMGVNVTGWTVGYLLGTPLAGVLLGGGAGGGSGGVGGDISDGATGAAGVGMGVERYRPAIFYAGGVAAVSAVCVGVARWRVGREGKRRV